MGENRPGSIDHTIIDGEPALPFQIESLARLGLLLAQRGTEEYHGRYEQAASYGRVLYDHRLEYDQQDVRETTGIAVYGPEGFMTSQRPHVARCLLHMELGSDGVVAQAVLDSSMPLVTVVRQIQTIAQGIQRLEASGEGEQAVLSQLADSDQLLSLLTDTPTVNVQQVRGNLHYLIQDIVAQKAPAYEHVHQYHSHTSTAVQLSFTARGYRFIKDHNYVNQQEQQRPHDPVLSIERQYITRPNSSRTVFAICNDRTAELKHMWPDDAVVSDDPKLEAEMAEILRREHFYHPTSRDVRRFVQDVMALSLSESIE